MAPLVVGHNPEGIKVRSSALELCNSISAALLSECLLGDFIDGYGMAMGSAVVSYTFCFYAPTEMIDSLKMHATDS